MIELTDEMEQAFHEFDAATRRGEFDRLGFGLHLPTLNKKAFTAALTAVLAIVERDRCLRPRGHGGDLTEGLCSATVETRDVLVRCGKKADGHDTHLGRLDGWDVVW